MLAKPHRLASPHGLAKLHGASSNTNEDGALGPIIRGTTSWANADGEGGNGRVEEGIVVAVLEEMHLGDGLLRHRILDAAVAREGCRRFRV